MAPLALVAAGFLGAKLFAGSQKQAQAQTIQTPSPTQDQTVDAGVNKTSASANLGRAALIATSPQGVLGTDPVGRYKLLGN